MPVSQVGSATVYNSAVVTTTVTNAVPTGTQEWDLLLWTVTIQTNAAVPLPSGWNYVGAGGANLTGIGVGFFWRWAPASPPADYAVTTPSARASGSMVSLRGVDVNTPIVHYDEIQAGTGSPVFTQEDPTGAAEIVGMVGSSLASGSALDYTGTNADSLMAESATASGTGTNVGTAMIREYLASGGSFTPTMTVGTAMTRSISITFEVKPIAGVAPPAGNLQPYSSFEVDPGDWDPSGAGVSWSIVTDGTAPHGTKVGRLAAGSAGASPQVKSTGSLLIPIVEDWRGLYLTFYAQHKWDSVNTPGSVHLDLIFMDESLATIVARIGTSFTPSGSWTRTQNNDNPIPTLCRWVAVRFVIVNSAVGDVVLWDQMYATIGANIHNTGPHPDYAVHMATEGAADDGFFAFL